jgi:CheY-like chemotaxis protein
MGTTLLLADDSITIQKVVGIIFANEDYELVVVDNGTSALEKAREIKPDLMLVDALMPGKSGYEVCEEVRRDPLLKGTPLLLLVGAFEPFDEDKARASGADDHITKPFESQSLIDKVKALIQLSATREPAVSPVQEEVSMAVVVAEPEEIIPEPLEAPAATTQPDSPVAAVDTSAKLFDSFRGFVHLGSDAAKAPAVAEPVCFETEVPETTVPAEPEGVILLSSVDIVEASPEDDPWGTFSEVVEDGDEIHFGEVLDESSGVAQELSETVEEIEPFALMEEESESGSFGVISLHDETVASDEIGVSEEVLSVSSEEPITEMESPAEDISAFEPSDSGSISLGDFSPVHESEDFSVQAIEEPLEEQPAEIFGFSPEHTDLPFAQEEEFVPAEEVLSASEVETPIPASSATDAVIALSEEQLTAAISKISREIIEKIAWEVVPDLAENLIKEEIRKIKEGLGRN